MRKIKKRMGIGKLGDMRKQEIFILGSIAAVLLGAFSAVIHIKPTENITNASAIAVATTTEAQAEPFKNLALEARSVFVWDVQEKKALFERNADQVVPLASVTKVMMAMTALDLIPKNTVITIDSSFLEQEGDSGLFAGESWNFKDLLDYSLVVSSNDGASAIAAVAGSVSSGSIGLDIGRAEFIRKMNAKARAIGLEKTRFNNENGLDTTDTESGGYGTARDMAKMFEYALANYPDILEATKYPNIRVSSLDNISHVAHNTNQDVNKIPGIVASKTGYTDLSGGNVVIVFDAGLNHPVIISVLGSTYEGRFIDAYKLAQAAQEAVTLEDPKLTSSETADLL